MKKGERYQKDEYFVYSDNTSSLMLYGYSNQPISYFSGSVDVIDDLCKYERSFSDYNRRHFPVSSHVDFYGNLNMLELSRNNNFAEYKYDEYYESYYINTDFVKPLRDLVY